MLVEVVPKQEMKSAGGLYLEADLDDHRSSTKENRADLVIVLATGNGYYDEETGEDAALDIPVGAVCLVSRLGLKLYSDFPGLKEYTKESIALTRDNEVHAMWTSIDAFKEYQKLLNASIPDQGTLKQA